MTGQTLFKLSEQKLIIVRLGLRLLAPPVIRKAGPLWECRRPVTVLLVGTRFVCVLITNSMMLVLLTVSSDRLVTWALILLLALLTLLALT